MSKSFLFVLLLFISLPIAAQQYTSKELGKLSTATNTTLSVAVDSSQTIILSTPAHSIYIDAQLAGSFKKTLDAVLAGMKELEARDITVVDHRMVGKLTFAGAQDINLDGLVFRLEFNATRADKVLLLMYSSRNMEDLLFNSSSLAQLDDLVAKALKSVADYSDQYAFIQATLDKIYLAAFR